MLSYIAILRPHILQQFMKGKMHGEGKFIFPDGASYDNDEYLAPGLSIPDKLRIPVSGHGTQLHFTDGSI